MVPASANLQSAEFVRRQCISLNLLSYDEQGGENGVVVYYFQTRGLTTCEKFMCRVDGEEQCATMVRLIVVKANMTPEQQAEALFGDNKIKKSNKNRKQKRMKKKYAKRKESIPL